MFWPHRKRDTTAVRTNLSAEVFIVVDGSAELYEKGKWNKGGLKGQ
jgi:hypothetical protein